MLELFDCTALAYVWRYLSTGPRGVPAKGSTRMMKDMVKRSDMFRFLVLFVYGGVYADMDIAARSADVTR